MLSSIHPLGERARHNSWILTAGAFVTGAAASGGAVGAVLGWAGGIIAAVPVAIRLLALGGLAIIAAAADALTREVAGPRRQVNERWIGNYRGWVYGGGFGAQLGVGSATFVVTWGVYLTYAAAFLSAHPAGGGLIGMAFGLGRSLTIITAGYIDRPTRLDRYHRLMARLASPVRVATPVVTCLVGVVALMQAVR
jgi:hypothetical protein